MYSETKSRTETSYFKYQFSNGTISYKKKAHTTSYNRVPFSASLFPLPFLLSTNSSKKKSQEQEANTTHALSLPDH